MYQMLSSTFTKKTQGLIKSVTQKDDHSFWHMLKVCMFVTLFTGVILQIYHITSRFCSIKKDFAVMQKHAGEVANVIILHIIAVAQSANAVKNVLWHWGQEVFQHPPSSADLIPCGYDVIPRLKQPLIGQQFVNLWDIFKLGAKWHKLAHERVPVAFATFSVIGISRKVASGTTLSVVKNLNLQFVLYHFFHVHCVCHNETTHE